MNSQDSEWRQERLRRRREREHEARARETAEERGAKLARRREQYREGGHDRVKKLARHKWMPTDQPNSIAGASRCLCMNREHLLSIDASMQSMAYACAQYSYILQFLHSTSFTYWHACNIITFLTQACPTMSYILLVIIHDHITYLAPNCQYIWNPRCASP